MANNGLGKGPSFYSDMINCSGNGASHGGYGGIGIPIKYEQNILDLQEILECKNLTTKARFFLYSFPYSTNYPFSGGSGGGINEIDSLLGAGGGSIYLLSANLIILNGNISANGISGISKFDGQKSLIIEGGSGQYNIIKYLSSGGSIFITTPKIYGKGQISVNGGDSKFGFAGEGSGGNILINILNWGFQQMSIEQFSGPISAMPGSRKLNQSQILATSGSIIGSYCPLGFYLETDGCRQCPNGTYKDQIHGNCKNCLEGDKMTQSEGNIFPKQCYNQCNDLMCNPILKYVNDITRYGILWMFSFLFFFIGGIVIRRYYKRTKVEFRKKPFDFELETQQLIIHEIITDDLKEEKDFKMADLLYHSHRIQVFGSNTTHNSWFLNPEVPAEIEYLVIKDKYSKFVHKFNAVALWNIKDKIVIIATYVLYYPIYWYLVSRMMKKKWKNVRLFVEQYDFSKLVKFSSSDFKIKFSKSIDYTLCFLDIMNYQKSNLKYFYLEMPYVIQLSGNGTFLKPFYINTQDPFAKCLYFAISQKQNIEQNEERFKILDYLVTKSQRNLNSLMLNKFFSKFNQLSQCMEFSGSRRNFYLSIRDVVGELKRWNNEFFSQFHIHIDLIIIQCPKMIHNLQMQIITILQNDLDEDVFKASIYKIQDTKFYDDTFDVKFALYIFNTQSTPTSIGTLMHENKLNPGESQNRFQFFDSFIGNKDEEIIDFTYDKGKKEQEELKMQKTVKKKILRGLFYYRYFFCAHVPMNKFFKLYFSKYGALYLQSLLTFVDFIVTITFIINIYYALEEQNNQQEIYFMFLPYPLVVILSPALGIILMSSQSYGIAKLYLIVNQMAILSCFLQFWYVLIEGDYPFMFVFIKLIMCMVKLAISQIGSLAICFTHKLNSLKVKDNQQ